MTGWGTVSGSPSLLRGMPKRAPVVTEDVGVGKSVQSSPLLALRLKTWRILIGDLRLFLPLPVTGEVFFESLLHSLVFLLLLWTISCLSSLQWNVKMTSSSNSSIWNQSLIKTSWCTYKQPKNSYSQAQKDSVRYFEVWLLSVTEWQCWYASCYNGKGQFRLVQTTLLTYPGTAQFKFWLEHLLWWVLRVFLQTRFKSRISN
jgi:hypothetical protein